MSYIIKKPYVFISCLLTDRNTVTDFCSVVELLDKLLDICEENENHPLIDEVNRTTSYIYKELKRSTVISQQIFEILCEIETEVENAEKDIRKEDLPRLIWILIIKKIENTFSDIFKSALRVFNMNAKLVKRLFDYTSKQNERMSEIIKNILFNLKNITSNFTQMNPVQLPLSMLSSYTPGTRISNTIKRHIPIPRDFRKSNRSILKSVKKKNK